ncbi:leucyl aminopeptidase family protein [Candidatus Paracaedibacter symbiosus]|uniref:leucyl aminopeptidase family protein n=1 Tax=Candidatus Paracaedibacter symbiosus TaxID=244582 RepID=UPI00068B7932|nr:leucyl aminopeptidase family protein [Candidatus Paracaedibacter symbiosus]
MSSFFIEAEAPSIPISCLNKNSYLPWLEKQDSFTHGWLKSTGFTAEPGSIALIPTSSGSLAQVLWGEDETFWQYAALAQKLPMGTFRLEADLDTLQANQACLAWGLSFYSFKKYCQAGVVPAKQLAWPKTAEQTWVEAHLEAITNVRDWINMPAADFTPDTLANLAQNLAQKYQATIRVVKGSQLKQDYPAVYTVGKAAAAEPCYIHLQHRHSQAVKKLSLVGKGVCFDSGGLDLKPASNMLLMKKDMGGAAHALSLSQLILAMNLPVDLDLYIPAVENSVSGNAMRPLDIIKTRKGLTVEIGNTDAEGRLILADALEEASQNKPDLIIDFATLTGAARVALGTDLPALFCNRQILANHFVLAATKVNDPVWPLPLHKPYAKQLKTPFADLSSTGKSSYGGAIIAALFLDHFIAHDTPWIHLDLMAYNLSSTPGRPEGGDAMALRAAYEFICSWLHDRR